MMNTRTKFIEYSSEEHSSNGHCKALGRFPMACLLILAFVVGGACSSVDEGAIPITTSSNKARDYFIKGRDLAERLRAAEANEYFVKALNEDSLFALAHLSIAGTQPSARAFFESFNKARSLTDSISEGEKLLIGAASAAIEGDQGLQESQLKELVALYPTDARAHNLLGQLYFNQQRWTEAIERYNESITLSPDYSSPYNQLGYCYRFIGELDKAAETFKKYTDLIPDDPNPHDSYAELLLKRGEFDLSIESYRRALSLNSGFVPSYVGIASNLCYQDMHSQARDELQQLYAVARNNGHRRTALYGIAATFVSEGLIDSALASIIKARKIAEQIDDVRTVAGDYGTMALLELERDNFTTAQTLYDSAITLINSSDVDEVTKSNNNRFYFFNCARVASSSGKSELADSLSSEFSNRVDSLSNIGQTALSHQLKGILALNNKEYKLALSELSQANPRNPYNNYRRALSYVGVGDTEQAVSELKIAVEFNSVLSINYLLVRGKAITLLENLSQ